MSYHLFLDDIRDPHWVHWLKLPWPNEPWVVVRSFDAFVETIEQKGLPDFIAFDHDLDEEGEIAVAKTGMDCAKWLVERCLDSGEVLPLFAVHSQNAPGRDNIHGLLSSFARHQQSNSKRPSP